MLKQQVLRIYLTQICLWEQVSGIPWSRWVLKDRSLLASHMRSSMSKQLNGKGVHACQMVGEEAGRNQLSSFISWGKQGTFRKVWVSWRMSDEDNELLEMITIDTVYEWAAGTLVRRNEGLSKNGHRGWQWRDRLRQLTSRDPTDSCPVLLVLLR